MGMLNPVIATLLADTKEYMAKMNEADEKMHKFGKTAEESGGKFHKFANTASNAVIGVGAAITGYAIDQALKFNEVLDNIQNQSGASAEEVDRLKTSIINVSNETAISSDKIGNAFLQVEKAGIRGASAYKLVDAAAKTAAITGGDVVSTTQTLIGIQRLQIARGMSVAQVGDLMVNANKMHVGSLESLTGVLTGKVGGALAATGMNLAEIASISGVASAAGYGTAKSYVALATGLQKIENPTASSAKQLKSLGLNADVLAQTARKPGTGLVDVLKMLEVQSHRTGIPMNTLIKDTFGTASVGMVQTLANNINKVSDANKKLQQSSGADLSIKFGLTSQQLNFKLKQLETQSKNALTGFGLMLLPDVTAVANFAQGAVKYFQKHPLVQKIASDAALTLFGASLAFKVAQAIGKIPGLGTLLGKIPGLGSLFKSTDTALLTEIAANTAATATEGAIADAELAKTGVAGGLAGFAKAFGIGALNFISDWAGPAAIAGLGVKTLVGMVKTGRPFTMYDPFGGQTTNGQPVSKPQIPNNAAIAALGGVVDVQQVSPTGNVFGPSLQVLGKQLDALNTLGYEGKLTRAQFNQALLNFSKQDQQRNYSLKVRITG